MYKVTCVCKFFLIAILLKKIDYIVEDFFISNLEMLSLPRWKYR